MRTMLRKRRNNLLDQSLQYSGLSTWKLCSASLLYLVCKKKASDQEDGAAQRAATFGFGQQNYNRYLSYSQSVLNTKPAIHEHPICTCLREKCLQCNPSY